MHPLLEALLMLYPSMSGWVSGHPETPAAVVAAAERHGVPTSVLMSVCFAESRLGADRRTPLTCGVYRVPQARQPDAAAHALARWRARCRSWRGALRMFYGGGCGGPDPHGYARRVLALASRLERAAAHGGPRPPPLR